MYHYGKHVQKRDLSLTQIFCFLLHASRSRDMRSVMENYVWVKTTRSHHFNVPTICFNWFFFIGKGHNTYRYMKLKCTSVLPILIMLFFGPFSFERYAQNDVFCRGKQRSKDNCLSIPFYCIPIHILLLFLFDEFT